MLKLDFEEAILPDPWSGTVYCCDVQYGSHLATRGF